MFKGPGKYADRVEIKIVASAAPNLGSFHGFHIHTDGRVQPGARPGRPTVPFGSAGGHWNPSGANHGAHKGDLPSVLMTAEGETYAEFETDRFNVTELLDARGRRLRRRSSTPVPTTSPTSRWLPTAPPNATTLDTGDAGGRYACGVVRRS